MENNSVSKGAVLCGSFVGMSLLGGGVMLRKLYENNEPFFING